MWPKTRILSNREAHMAIFGDIERLLADLYPYRWAIAAVILLILAGVGVVGYKLGWHLALWRRRVKVAIVGIPGLAVIIAAGFWLGSPLFTNTTVDEAFPLAAQAVVPTGMTRSDVPSSLWRLRRRRAGCSVRNTMLQIPSILW